VCGGTGTTTTATTSALTNRQLVLLLF